MIKKIFFQFVFFNFFLTKEVFAAESGGMPQLNPEFWISQIFWLVLTFGTLYVALSKLILPKISANLELRKSQIQENIEAAEKKRRSSESKLILPKISQNLESRKSQILENIEAAEKQRENSDAKLKEYEEIILKSKLEAKNIFNQAREKALKDINSKKEVLDKQIDNEIIKAEQEIKVLQSGASEKINKIAIETSSELIQKLIGAEVNSSSISAIVDDLSKRGGDKYYGN